MEKISKKLQSNLERLYSLARGEEIIKFPDKEKVLIWEGILNKWINDSTLPLFVRRPSRGRGLSTAHKDGRTLLFTDNTPAHWVYAVMHDEDKFTFSKLKKQLTSFSVPIAMIRKITEREYLKDSQISSRNLRLGTKNWKVAHIDEISLPRTQSPEIEIYHTHHRKFLSLSNIYLIRKDFSGLAEVKYFNAIVKANLSCDFSF